MTQNKLCQPTLFELPEKETEIDKRTNSMFLRNEFTGDGKWEIPLVKKQTIETSWVDLVACTNTKANDNANCDLGVHFFVDDYKFANIYKNPKATLARYSQYRFCCTPDFSLYREMPLYRQIESVAKNRWCGAWWQAHGIVVIPTISWSDASSFEFCFDGVEKNSIVAVATYACRSDSPAFLRGWSAMQEHISPEVVICYGGAIPGMNGNIIEVPAKPPYSPLC